MGHQVNFKSGKTFEIVTPKLSEADIELLKIKLEQPREKAKNMGTTMIYEEPQDNVNHPKHYLKGGLECIQVIKAQLTPEQYKGYLYGNVIKYMWRWQDKNGEEDLRKAEHYLQWLREEVENNGN